MESSYIHSDIIYDILLRTSSNTLGRCKMACKEWNKTTYDSTFKKIRSQKIDIVDGFFVHDQFTRDYTYSFASFNGERISLDFIPGQDVRIQAVSANNGIILCTSQNFRQYYVPFFFVCKPQIKLFQQIPNPRTRFLQKGMAISSFRSNPFHYKILRISSSKRFGKDGQQLILEVFNSESWKWKRLKNILMPFGVSFWSESSVVTACGAFHWLLYPNLIFSFDIKKEEWKITGLPTFEDDYKSVDMVEYEGKLALMCMDRKGYMHAWVLESYLNMVWQVRFVVSMIEAGSTYLTYIPMLFYGSDIVVVRGFWSLKYYDIKNEKILKEVKLERHDHPRYIFPFLSDSEPCCLKPVQEIIDCQCSSRKTKKRKREIGSTESSRDHGLTCKSLELI